MSNNQSSPYLTKADYTESWSDPLHNYSYGARLEEGYSRYEGTEDFITVVEIDDDESYEWDQFKGFYSPSKRRYFWHSDAGCSCNGWDDSLQNDGSFENGSKKDMANALERYAKDDRYSNFPIAEYQRGVQLIANFKETSS